MSEKLTILHTNDMHSHLENWPKIRRFLVTQRQQLLREGGDVLTFDIGDAIDRIHPLTEASLGQANIAIMNDIHYDAVTIGNNEGLGLSHDAMNHLYDHANFPIVLGNLKDKKEHKVPDWAVEYKIMTTKSGTKVGILGFTAPFVLTFPLLGWQPETVSAALERLLPEIQAKSDIVIVLSHWGLPTDRYLAKNFPKLNVIIGAHTHHLLENGELHGNTLLAAAGRYGTHVGRITLTLDDHQIVKMVAETIVTEKLPALSEDAVEIDSYLTKGASALVKEQVAELPREYSHDIVDNHALVMLGLKALEERTQTDIAMLSTGLFLTDLTAGIVTKYDLHRMLPHAVHAMKTELLGSDLWRLVHEVAKNRHFMKAAKIRGMGFQGKEWGEIIWDGVKLLPNGDVLVHNEPLNFSKRYVIGSLDHYLFIPYFPTLEIAGNNLLLYETVLREDLAAYLAKHFTRKEEEYES